MSNLVCTCVTTGNSAQVVTADPNCPRHRPSNLVLVSLFERLRMDGGRYLLSVAMTPAEIAAAEKPTFGGKASRRWLTDEEYAALCALGFPVGTSDRIGWCGDASGSPFGPTEPPDDVGPDQPMLQGPGGKLIGHLPDQLLDVHAICDDRDRLRLQLQRALILLKEAPLHRYGNEYLQWCEKRRLQNAGLNAATCEHPPEWRSHGKCGICLQDVTPLEPRETSDRLPDAVLGALTDACMILDVVKGEWAEAWSEWDQGVRDRITKLLIANHEARSNTTEPPATGLAAQIEAAKQRIARWPRDVRTALGLPVEPSLQRCPECGVECRGTPIPAIVHLTGCSQENGSPVTTENNDG